MARTISANTISVYLTSANPSDSPLTVLTGVTVSGSVWGVKGDNSQAWTVTNQGSISGKNFDGVFLGAGGIVTNSGTAAHISGGKYGVGASGAASVINQGTISGKNYDGVYLGAGGIVTNSDTAARIAGGNFGVYAKGSAASVINQGTISGATYSGVELLAGGAVTNSGTAAVISGAASGVYVNGGAGNVTNQGTISGTSNGVYLKIGGTVTNSGTAAIISGVRGVVAQNGAASVTNQGTITGTSVGVYLVAGGTVTNSGTAAIITALDGVAAENGAATVINQGTITGTSGVGVLLVAGGIVTNSGAAASIYGLYAGVSESFGASTVTNQGTISGGKSAGVVLDTAGGVVVNSGHIAGGTDAVQFRTGYVFRLVIDPGAVFSGKVDGGNTIGGAFVSTMELASGASIGAFSGIGAHYIDFAQITIDANASWALTGSNSLASGGTITNSGSLTLSSASLVDSGALVNNGVIVLDPSSLTVAALNGTGLLTIGASGTLDAQGTVAAGETIAFGGNNALLQIDSASAFTGTINGFAANRTIELTNVTHNFTDTASIVGSNTLQVVTKGGTFDLQLDKSQDFTGNTFPLTANGTGTNINLACFAEGTRIATERGMVPVQALREDDLVRTLLDGGIRPIVWLGHRRVDCRCHPEPTSVWPIRIAAGAFGPGRPFCDLWLSPDHAVFVNGVLIPIRYLVNGRTIRQEARDEVTYWHVELAEHNVLYAEGVPAESYLDTGNRSAFANGGAVMDLHADFARRVWETRSCAPLVLNGPKLAAAKRRLHDRVNAFGHRTTNNADLKMLVNGSEVFAKRKAGTLHVRLPGGTEHVQLISRVWIPAHMQADAEDARSLGIAVSRVWMDAEEIGLDEACFTHGWHVPEQDWRWSNGNGWIATWGARELALEVALNGTYWLEQQGCGKDQAA